MYQFRPSPLVGQSGGPPATKGGHLANQSMTTTAVHSNSMTGSSLKQPVYQTVSTTPSTSSVVYSTATMNTSAMPYAQMSNSGQANTTVLKQGQTYEMTTTGSLMPRTLTTTMPTSTTSGITASTSMMCTPVPTTTMSMPAGSMTSASMASPMPMSSGTMSSIPMTTAGAMSSMPMTTAGAMSSMPMTTAGAMSSMPMTTAGAMASMPMTTGEAMSSRPMTTGGAMSFMPMATAGAMSSMPMTTGGVMSSMPMTTAGAMASMPMTTAGAMSSIPMTTAGAMSSMPMTTGGASTSASMTSMPMQSSPPKTSYFSSSVLQGSQSMTSTGYMPMKSSTPGISSVSASAVPRQPYTSTQYMPRQQAGSYGKTTLFQQSPATPPSPTMTTTQQYTSNQHPYSTTTYVSSGSPIPGNMGPASITMEMSGISTSQPTVQASEVPDEGMTPSQYMMPSSQKAEWGATGVTSATAAAVQGGESVISLPNSSSPPTTRSTPIVAGSIMPPAHIDLHGVCVNLQEFFEDRSGIIFGVLGAYNPQDTKVTVPSILANMPAFERLVDFVGCLAVNDPFVIKAWAKKLGVSDQFTFIADNDARFAEALGMTVNLPEEGLGIRCQRFAAVVGAKSTFRYVAYEDEARADNILTVLPKYVRTPWKSFLIGLSYEIPGSASNESVYHSLTDIRSYLTEYGFCPESDWQLILSNCMEDVFKPTAENIISGLKWLVDGAQAGDVLCCYINGRTEKRVDPDSGEETTYVLGIDHADGGVVSVDQIASILLPSVPENCRLNIIVDGATLPLNLPYKNGQLCDSSMTPMDTQGEIFVMECTMPDDAQMGPASIMSKLPKSVSYTSVTDEIESQIPSSAVTYWSSRPIQMEQDMHISDIWGSTELSDFQDDVLPLEVEPTQTVAQVVAIVEELTSITPIQLTHNNQLLSNTQKSLADYKVAENDFVTAMQVPTTDRYAELAERIRQHIAAPPVVPPAFDPDSEEGQRRIMEAIKMENLNRNLEEAAQSIPESFVNGVPVQAFVDSGAQASIMSQELASRCNLTYLIDPRYSGVARGVGEAKIVGRIHKAVIDCGGVEFDASFTIVDTLGHPLLFGLDILYRHQCCIDLKRRVLRIADVIDLPFLDDSQIEKS